MITAYMVTVAVAACGHAIGLPLGHVGRGDRRNAHVPDVAVLRYRMQTFPSFIYLIPVIMLFGVNDVAAIFAVVIFALRAD